MPRLTSHSHVLRAPRARAVIALALVALLSAIASAQQAAPQFRPPEDIKFRTDTIISEGTRMAAEIYAPASAAADARLPTIILSHGWGGVAAHLRPEAVAFARAGYLVVSFDYRGWGASDSRVVLVEPAPKEKKDGTFTAEVREVREVVDPIDQTTDLLNAIHWVQAEPQCDPDRIGLWGSSYSGGHVVYAAARDPRVKATVSQVPAFDSRFVLTVPEEREKTYSQATARTRGEIGYPEPGAREVGNLRGGPIREKLMTYAPVEDADRASQCATLFILAENEELFDNREHGMLAHERARGPKKMVIVPGIQHYGIYTTARKQAQQMAIEWFDEHLKGQAPAAAADAAR